MRKLAMLTTALLGLAFTIPAFAQPSQAGPQPGLPPGAGIGAQNAVPAPATGQTTTTGMPAPSYTAPMASEQPSYTGRRHRARRHAMRHRARRHHRAPVMAAPMDAPAQ